MLAIVDDAFNAKGDLTATRPEKSKMADVWMRLLFGVIPEERLQDCFDYAFSVHSSTFPINAYDLKMAWEKISALETEKEQKAVIELVENNPTQFCSQSGLHFAGKHGDENIQKSEGLMLILVGGIGGTEQLAPCSSCRPKAHAQFLERRKQKPMTDIITEMMKPKPEDAISLIDEAINELGKEVLAGNGLSRKYWEKMTRVKKYLLEK